MKTSFIERPTFKETTNEMKRWTWFAEKNRGDL